MKKDYFKSMVVFATIFLVGIHAANAQLVAFPGAEGFGKYATGGRIGTVYHVTNLKDAGAGSLRDAVSQPNRIVVFDTAGVIKITARLLVGANIYLAGQTAPGEGITVYGNGWTFTKSSNTICRYMKIRMGIVGTSGKDANGLDNATDVIFDHCSVSWGRDENFSINSTTAQRITIQNCIISQGLLTHSAGGLIQNDGGITLYRNLYADNGTRNNKVKGVNQYVNNIVYNWSAGAYIMGGDSQGESFVNVTDNCFIMGPLKCVSPFSRANSLFHVYASDNISDSDRNGVLNTYPIQQSEYVGGPDFQSKPYSYPSLPTLPASSLVDSLLPSVGASLPCRDLVDYYVVNEVKTFGKKGEFIASEDRLPFGAPTTWKLWGGAKRVDTDNDGMPDDWENANGTNPIVDDAMVISANGYANIENYINGINTNSAQNYLRAPLNLKADSATQSSISLSWFDYTQKELGYIVEQKINGSFVQIAVTGIDTNYYKVTGLKPEEVDTFRVRAFNATDTSAYTNVLVAKSRPIEVPVLDVNTFAPDLTWSGNVSKDWDSTSLNWLNGASAALFADSSKLLFGEAGSAGQTINITAQMGPKDIVVNSSGDYSFTGTGLIAGNGSINKVGSGTLSLLTDNKYKGATVLHEGTIVIDSLANGLKASSIGASANYAFNWVLKGGKMSYIGANTSTDRSMSLDATSEFNITKSTVTMTGVISGSGGLIKSGAGRLVLKNTNPYLGETTITGGVLEITPVSSATLAGDIIDNCVAIGTSNVLRLHGGTFRTSGGSSTIYENYPIHIYVDDSTVNGLEPYRNANLSCTVSGNGTLNYAIPYVRELIQGDWSDFTGTLVANGLAAGNILMIDNGIGFPNNRVVTAGGTKIATYQNNETLYLGGLSGPAGTMLSTGGTKTASFGNGHTTYSVGAMGTDETFNGVINDQLYGNTTDANGTTTIIKEGTGVWRLTGKNTYKGTTTVEGGSLIINGSHTGTGSIYVSQGILAGKGNVAGDVFVQTGGTLQPGDSAIGNFTLKGKLALDSGSVVDIDINKAKSTWDKLTITGAVSLNGTLKINSTDSFAVGDVFKILVLTTSPATGNFTNFIPATPGDGLAWSFSPTTGELSVVSALPVKLISFSGANDSKGNLLKWTTSNEINLSSYIIERSIDGRNFTNIGNVTANKNASANSYSFVDANISDAATIYYRLKSVDAVGFFEYSKTIAITKSIKSLFNVYPNPVTSTINISHGKAGANTVCRLYALNGKLILVQQVKENATQTSIDVSRLANGSYQLTLLNGLEKSSTIIIKK